MKDYWNSLTARERLMLSLMAALVGLVVLWLVIVRPLSAARDEAAREYATATALYESVATSAAEMRALHREGRDAKLKTGGEPLRVTVAVAARTAGVSISRIQPGEDGTLTIWADDVSAAALYRWLEALANERQITPAKVSVQKAGSGQQLRAQIQFSEAG